MPDTSALETFLNERSCKDGDVVEILGGGVILNKEDPETKKKYSVLQLPVRCNGRELTYQPNSDAMKVFNQKLGTNSDTWTGTKFQVKQYPKTAFGVTNVAILPMLMK